LLETNTSDAWARSGATSLAHPVPEEFFMSTDDDAIKRRYREFLDLLPLTVAIAGLSSSEGGRNFTSEQMQTRAQVLGNAFKLARQTVRESLK
jgi:hypothetical protein